MSSRAEERPPCEPRQQQMPEWQRSLILVQEKAASEVSWRNCQQNPPSVIEKEPTCVEYQRCQVRCIPASQEVVFPEGMGSNTDMDRSVLLILRLQGTGPAT